MKDIEDEINLLESMKKIWSWLERQSDLKEQRNTLSDAIMEGFELEKDRAARKIRKLVFEKAMIQDILAVRRMQPFQDAVPGYPRVQ